MFRKFIPLYIVKSSNYFINSKGSDGKKDQVNSLYRIKELYCENKFFPPGYKEQISLDALVEEMKFEEFIDGEPWPKKMISSRTNLLRSTIFDT